MMRVFRVQIVARAEHLSMRKLTRWRLPTVDAGGRRIVSSAGGVLMVRTARTAGLDRALTAALAPWRRPMARHDPGKVVLDLAVALALGGDCLADIAKLRAAPDVFGPVASDPTVSRLLDVLAADAPKVLSALASARRSTRARVWQLAGGNAPDHGVDAGRPIVIDVDATLLTAHAEKESASSV